MLRLSLLAQQELAKAAQLRINGKLTEAAFKARCDRIIQEDDERNGVMNDR